MERRKDVLDEILEKLDDPCSFILVAITMNPKGLGFNKLHRKIQKQPKTPYNKMAKSTLSEHLQHLLKKNLIENEIDKSSPLKIKPSRYRTSKYFRDLSRGFLAQSTTPEDYLPLMRSKDVNSVTMQLMNVMSFHLSECVKTTLLSPENIAIYNMHQCFYNLETLMTAYRKRIREKKQEITAIKLIQAWFSNINKIKSNG